MTPETAQATAPQREKFTHETLGPDYKPGPLSVTTWEGGREENQDAFFSFAVMPESYCAPNEKENLKALSVAGYELVIVADGMGGHQSGAEASQVLTKEAMSVFVREFATYYEQVIQKPLASSSPAEIQQFIRDKMAANLPSLLRYAIVEGNKKVKNVAGYAEAPVDKKPGSTIVATFFDRNTNKHVIANVGDSRAQKITSRGKLEQVTEDHSPVQRLLKMGSITEEVARNHPQRNVIDRSLSGQEIKKPTEYIDVFTVELKPGEVLILNSDGLEVLSRAEIEKVIKEAKQAGVTIDRALVGAVDRKQFLALSREMVNSGLFAEKDIKAIVEGNAGKSIMELAKILLEKAEAARREAIFEELNAREITGWPDAKDIARKLKDGSINPDEVIDMASNLVFSGSVNGADVNHLLNGKRFRKIESYHHDNITVVTIGEVKNDLGNELLNRVGSIWESVRNLFKGIDKKTTPATTGTAQSPEQGDAKPEKSGPLAKAWKWLTSWKERRAAKRSAAESRTAPQSPEASTSLTVEQSIQALLATLKSKDRNLLLKLGLIKNTEEDEGDDSEIGALAELGRQRTETIQNAEKISDLEARIEKNKQAERDIATEVRNYLISLYGQDYLNHLNQDNHVYINRRHQDILDIRAIRADLERQLEEAKQETGEAVGSAVEELTIDGLAFNPKRRRQVKRALERVLSSNEEETRVADIKDALQKHLHVLETSAWKPFESLQQKPLFMKIKGIFEKLGGYAKKQWENRPKSFAEWKDRARDKSIERWEKRKDSYDKKEQTWRTKLNLESVSPEELTAWELALRKGQTLEARQLVALVLEQKIGSIPELNKHKKILKEAGIDLQYDLMDWLKFQWEKKLTDERMEADANVRKQKEEKAGGNSPETRKELRKAIVAQTEAYLKWLNLKVYDHVKKSAILEAQVDRFGRPNATGIAKEDVNGTGWQGLVNNLRRYMSLPKTTAGQRDVAYYVTYLPSMIGLLTAPGLTAGAKNVIMGVTSGVSVGGEVIKQRIEAQYGGDSEAYWESLRAKEGLSSKVLFALQRIAVSRAIQSVRDGISGGAMAAQVSSLFGFDTFAYQLREGIDRAAQGLSGELPADIQGIVEQNPEIVAEMEELQAELDRVAEEAAQQAESLQTELSDAQQVAKDLEAKLEERTRQLAAEQERLAEELAKPDVSQVEEVVRPSVAPPVEEVAQEVATEAASHLPEALVDYGDQVVQMKGGDFLGDFSALWTANRNLSAELDPTSNANSMAGFLTRAFRALNPGVDPARLDPEKTYNFLTEEAVKALLPEIRAAEKVALERGISSLDLPQQLMAAGIEGRTYPVFNDEQLALVLKTALNK